MFTERVHPPTAQGRVLGSQSQGLLSAAWEGSLHLPHGRVGPLWSSQGNLRDHPTGKGHGEQRLSSENPPWAGSEPESGQEGLLGRPGGLVGIRLIVLSQQIRGGSLGKWCMMEHRPADLLAACPYILLTTPMTLTLTLESGGDVIGRAQHDLGRTQSTRDKEGRGQGHVLPDSQCHPGKVGGCPWPCNGSGQAGGHGPSVLLVPSLPPRVDELPEEQLATKGAPGVLRVAATAGEAVSVHHTSVGQGIYLEAQGRW